MSISFSNTTTKAGLIQLLERTLGFNDGGISGNSTLLAYFTADINLTIDEVFGFMFPRGGSWQLDDSNHTKYPTIYTDLVSGQRDYSFTTDEQSNVILDIYKVMILPSSTATLYQDVYPVDVQSDSDVGGLASEDSTTGIPLLYDKTANGIFLDPIPSYSATRGLKVYINREGSYFLTTDTTKKVGFAHLFHEYFALAPAYRYARNQGLANAERLKRDVLELKDAIKKYYATRQKDVRQIITMKKNNYI